MPATPPEHYRTRIKPEWIDYNGHMNLAYYLVVFDGGSEALARELGLDEAYRHASNHTLYVVEIHLTYAREVKEGEEVAVTTQLIGVDDKRFHMFHRMIHTETGDLVATAEIMNLHVDLKGPKAVPFPADARARLDAMMATHREMPRPPQLGRVMAVKTASPPA